MYTGIIVSDNPDERQPGFLSLYPEMTLLKLIPFLGCEEKDAEAAGLLRKETHNAHVG